MHAPARLQISQLSVSQAGALSSSEWIAECGKGSLVSVLGQARQHHSAARKALEVTGGTSEQIPTEDLRAGVEFFGTLNPRGSAQRTDCEQALGRRLSASSVVSEQEEGRALLREVLAASRKYRTDEDQRVAALDLATAEERCGDSARATALRTFAQEREGAPSRAIASLPPLMGTLPAIPLAVPTSALYARGLDETRARLTEVSFDDNYAALMVGSLADNFHDA